MKPPPRGFKPNPYPYHHELTLRVENLTNTGLGVCRDNGWVIMLPFVIPGELVRARIHRNHKNFSDADPLEILEPAPTRVSPSCSLYTECGGCQYQHIAYDSQLTWKKQQLEELFSHHLKRAATIEAVHPSPKTTGYRSKITPHYNQSKKETIGAIGFHKQGCRTVLVDVPRCEIAMEPLNTTLTSLRKPLLNHQRPTKKGATLLLRSNLAGEVFTHPNDICSESVGGIQFQFKAGGFFQNNPYILEAFTSYAADQASSGGARYLIDAYCGTGLFALTASSRFERVLGVEISDLAVRDAQANAQLNQITHCTFVAATADQIFANVPFPSSETAVILDPPRSGCDEAFLNQLFAFDPARIVYISCNPATQLRDFAAFQAHGYEPLAIRPFDLFPQTRHLECVMTLEKLRKSEPS